MSVYFFLSRINHKWCHNWEIDTCTYLTMDLDEFSAFFRTVFLESLVLVMVVTAVILYYSGYIFIQIVDLKELIAHEQTYGTDYTISSEGIYLVYQNLFWEICVM